MSDMDIDGDIPVALRSFFISQKKKGIGKDDQIKGMKSVCSILLDEVYGDIKNE
jgi:hypothetical protein